MLAREEHSGGKTITSEPTGLEVDTDPTGLIAADFRSPGDGPQEVGETAKRGKARVRSLAVHFRWGVFWNLVAGVCSQGATFLGNLLAARILGRQVFGEYSFFQSTLVTIAALLQLSIGYTATKYVAEFFQLDKEKTSRILGLGRLLTVGAAGIGSLIIVAAAPWLSAHALRLPAGGSTLLMIGSGFLFFSVINGFQMGVLVGLRSYRGLAVSGLVSGAFSATAIALGALRFGLTGAVCGLALGALVRCLVHSVCLKWQLVRHALSFRYDDLGKEAGVLFRFALPSALAGYITMTALWLANCILVRGPDGYMQMGLYSAALNIRLLVGFLPNVINTVGVAFLNEVKGKKDAKQYKWVFWTNLYSIGLTTLLMVLCLGFFGDRIMGLFGRGFPSGRTVLWVLLLSTPLESLSSAVYQIIHSHAKIWLSLSTISLPRELLLVFLAYLWTPSDGALGMAYAYLAAQAYSLVSHILLATFVHNKYSAGWSSEGRPRAAVDGVQVA
jgi:O-antigen/teichoic acid export membrane protein